MTTDVQVKLWALAAERQFSFLQTEGYQVPVRKLDSSWGKLTYLSPGLGIRLEVESDGFFMFVALFRPENPAHDASLYLQECFRRLGIRNPAVSRVHELRGEFGNLSAMLSIYAEALRSNIVTLRSGSSELFQS